MNIVSPSKPSVFQQFITMVIVSFFSKIIRALVKIDEKKRKNITSLRFPVKELFIIVLCLTQIILIQQMEPQN